VAGEPIIMGVQRVSPDPEETARIEQRKGPLFDRAGVSSPFTDDFGIRAMLVPVPMDAPRSKRDQNARDERLNWMMLDRGDLTDPANSDELFGISSMNLEKESGRRDFFFTKPENSGTGQDRRLANSGAPHEAEERSGLPLESLAMPALSGKRAANGGERDGSSLSADVASGFGLDAGRGEEEELGLGALLNPARVSGSQALERWTSSLKEMSRTRSQADIPDAQDRREHYLKFLDRTHYGGPSYPVSTEWGKYQRDWMGSSAAGRPPPVSGTQSSGISGSRLIDPPSPMAPSGAASSLRQGTLGSPQGNLSGVGGLPSYLQERRPPSPKPSPDYSLPKAPGHGFDF
jgi:hypothetical protein